MNKKAHPKIYFKLGRAPRESTKKIPGRSEMEIAKRGGACAFAAWIYNAGYYAVMVLFAECGEEREGLIGAWHPRLPSRFVLMDFD